jgi:pSer/pThr/pTyr-binding forkhead associated (FHA) protein
MTIIGRREDCDLRIPLGDVSRKHCRVIKEADSVRVEDLGSSNGTYVNGQRVQEAILQPGDTVKVGPVRFVLQVDGVPADDELTPYDASAAAGMDSEASRAGRPAITRPERDENGEFDPMSALEGEPSNFDVDLSDELNNSGSQVNIEPRRDREE